MINEELVKSVIIKKDECDVIVERMDGSRYFLEVFCIMPDFPPSEDIKVISVKTHTQTAFSSVRQKLLNKIQKQGQFSKKRENFAVIEMNYPIIAQDFTVLSSLSSGYKVRLDPETKEIIGEGYDWSHSIFDQPETRFLKGIIWFHLGAYQYRKMILNPNFKIANG